MSNEELDSTLELDLLDNGVDFILKGIDELFDEEYMFRGYSTATDISISGYKYGVLHLFSGFLLLLKECLYRHLPELIFQGTVEEVKQKILSGKTPNTISLDEALKRLKSCSKEIFSEDEIQIIRNLQKIRNQFEHYKVSTNINRLWENISKFLELIDKFLVNELQIKIEDSPESSELHQKIYTIESVWKRVEQLQREEWSQDIQLGLINFKRERSQILEKFNQERRANKGYDSPFTTCPDCDKATLITIGEFEGICSNSECYSLNPLTECSRCGEIMPGFSWDFCLCYACTEWINEQ